MLSSPLRASWRKVNSTVSHNTLQYIEIGKVISCRTRIFFFFFLGGGVASMKHSGGKMHFWWGKNPTIFAIFFFQRGRGISGKGREKAPHAPLILPLPVGDIGYLVIFQQFLSHLEILIFFCFKRKAHISSNINKISQCMGGMHSVCK